MATNDGFAEYRKQKMKEGLEFQDFAIKLCFNTIGLVIVQYVSPKCQMEHGESRNGVEIKYDSRIQETGNVFIEIGEKAGPRGGSHAPSGIYRNDNTWLYLVGNYDIVFIFALTTLKLLHKRSINGNTCYREVPSGTETSWGFLLPVDEAKKFAAYVFDPPPK